MKVKVDSGYQVFALTRIRSVLTGWAVMGCCLGVVLWLSGEARVFDVLMIIILLATFAHTSNATAFLRGVTHLPPGDAATPAEAPLTKGKGNTKGKANAGAAPGMAGPVPPSNNH